MKRLSLFFLLFPFVAQAQTITTIAGTGIQGYNGDGIIATTAELHQPNGIALDLNGNIYIKDGSNRIRRVEIVTGIISAVAGNGTENSLSCDTVGNSSIPATSAAIYYISLIATDNAGNLYTNCNGKPKKITLTTGIMDTILSGRMAYHVAFDQMNNMYIAEDNFYVYKKDAITGAFTVVAGNGTFGISGNGGLATAASIDQHIGGLAVDTSGHLYISGMDRNTVRQVDLTTGIINSFAGTGSAGYSGDGFVATAAQLNHPQGVTVDRAGNVYIADASNNVVRKVTAVSRIISTIAGKYIPGYSGDGGSAISAQLNMPVGVAVDTGGNIFIADALNYRIRKISPPGVSVSNLASGYQLMLYPNPAQGELTIIAKERINDVTISNLLGQVVYNCTNSTDSIQIDIASLQAGVYFIKLNGTDVRKFVKR